MKAITIFRLITLTAISSIAIMFLVGEEQEENLTVFLLRVLFDKTLAIALFFTFFRLCERWRKSDTFFRWAFIKLKLNEEE